MAFGVARSARARVLRCATAILIGSAGLATAQETFVPPPLSPSCDAPLADLATPAPLPHLEEDLVAGRKIRVLAIGSSSTAGLGASAPAKNYPAVFESIMEKTFRGIDIVTINRGVSGEVAAMTAARIRNLAALEKPNLVLWQVGTNDALSRVSVESFADTVRETLRWLKANGIDVALVGLQYTLAASTDEHYIAIRKALREVASSENVLLVRRYEAMEFLERVKQAQLLSSDELHLNDLGYRCMAEHIARAVVASAFLKPKPAKPAN